MNRSDIRDRAGHRCPVFRLKHMNVNQAPLTDCVRGHKETVHILLNFGHKRHCDEEADWERDGRRPYVQGRRKKKKKRKRRGEAGGKWGGERKKLKSIDSSAGALSEQVMY